MLSVSFSQQPGATTFDISPLTFQYVSSKAEFHSNSALIQSNSSNSSPEHLENTSIHESLESLQCTATLLHAISPTLHWGCVFGDHACVTWKVHTGNICNTAA